MTSWTDTDLDRYGKRRAAFMRRGIAADQAEHLAARLVERDHDLDDRRLCLECANLAARACRVLKVEPLRELLQRCPTFTPMEGTP